MSGAPSSEPMLIWRFHEAPAELRALSDHGGDEDWLAVIPPDMVTDWIPWMDEGSSFGCCSVSECHHPTKPGYMVRIGAHA